MLLSLPSLSVISRFACRLGASGFGCRASSRALGGFVVGVGFQSSTAAGRAAALFGRWLPARCGGCVIRAGGGLFWVSVPVLPASVPAVVRRGEGPLVVVGSPPAVRSFVAAGGLWSVWARPFPSPPAVRPAGWASLRPAAQAAGWLGFSGSRSLPGSFSGAVRGLVSAASSSGRSVAVGCAPGLDALVRAACPSARVFRRRGSGPAAFAERSVRFVRALAGSGPGACLAVFPDRQCPNPLVPSRVPSFCFCGLGSGSWASAAFAAGLGVQVVVFGLPASSLPSSWGRWVPAGSGPWLGGFRLAPPIVQLSLF